MDQALSVAAVFGFTAFMVWLRDRKDERKEAAKHEIYRRMLDAGASPEAIREQMAREDAERTQRDIDRQRLGGMIALVAGLGLGVFLYGIRPEEPLYLIVSVPVLIGIVLLIHSTMVGRRQRVERS